jgi:hypothetical protein
LFTKVINPGKAMKNNPVFEEDEDFNLWDNEPVHLTKTAYNISAESVI